MHSGTEIGSAPLKMSSHGGQVEAIDRAVAQHFQIMPIAEIRRAQDGGADTRGERQPQQGPPDEQLRRHEVGMYARREHHDMKADEAHVMSERHPGQAAVFVVQSRRLIVPSQLAMILP